MNNSFDTSINNWKKLKKPIVTFSVVIWAISLILPTFIVDSHDQPWSGYTVLIAGWLGIAGIEDGCSLIGIFGWWANLFYFYSLKEYLDSEKLPLKAISWAVVLSLLSFFVNSLAISERPSYVDVIAYGPGALCWFFAILSLAYMIFSESGKTMQAQLAYHLGVTLAILYVIQVLWLAIGGDYLDHKHIPFYAAKRGWVCSDFLSQFIDCHH